MTPDSGITSAGNVRTSTRLFLASMAVVWTALHFMGCATYRTCPDVSQVHPGNAMPIDGLWKNKLGAIFRIEKGRVYTTSKLRSGTPPNKVIAKDIVRLQAGHYTGSTESYNKKDRLSSFGPCSIDLASTNSIRWSNGPNSYTKYKGETYEWTSYQLDDEQAFLREVIEMPDAPLSEVVSAVSRLTDQTLLAQLAKGAGDAAVRKSAIERVADEVVLAQAASDDSDAGVRQRAVSRIQDQTLLARLAKTAGDAAVRKSAIERVADEAVLVQVASDDSDAGVRQRAVSRIQDQALLAKVVTGAKDWDIRKVAFARIHDAEQLAAVAAGATDEAVRMAASVRLGRTTWGDIINEAQQNESKVGPAISAIAWADKQEALAVQVTGLCHRYIRKGDVARIAELRELLLLYGDRTLAEDYLNCGQSDLDAAGRAWANSHGYNVGTGYGSHRVRWGEDHR